MNSTEKVKTPYLDEYLRFKEFRKHLVPGTRWKGNGTYPFGHQIITIDKIVGTIVNYTYPHGYTSWNKPIDFMENSIKTRQLTFIDEN